MKKILCSTLILLMSSSSIFTLAQENTTNATVNNVENVGTIDSLGEVVPMAQYGSIKENNVNFRTAPGLYSTIIRQLHKGYFVTITYTDRVYKDGYWWTNVIYNGTSGWVADIYLERYY